MPETWFDMHLSGSTWSQMQKLECAICQTERERRNRLITDEDARLRKEPFCTAPYIHKNNQPKYHAMLLRAEEAAKQGGKYAL